MVGDIFRCIISIAFDETTTNCHADDTHRIPDGKYGKNVACFTGCLLFLAKQRPAAEDDSTGAV